MLKRLIFVAAMLMLSVGAQGQRINRTINESWQFVLAPGEQSVEVNIPHTWNNLDCQDEIPGYYRGVGEYYKVLRINESLADHSFYLHFEGVNQIADVYVNDHLAGRHVGGYTAFCFDITRYVRSGDNQIRVVVDNSHDENIPPLSADFTFFGGIYRDVTLIVTPKVHVSTTHFATSGVYVRTSDENRSVAKANVRTFLSNDASEASEVCLTHVVYDPAGKRVTEQTQNIKLGPNADNQCVSVDIPIKNPVLWGLQTPRMYCIRTTVCTRDGRSKDEVSTGFGIRWFKFDPNEGFSLNGEYVKLIGTSRHQDYYLQGNALRDEMHVRDVRLLKQMGGNFLRISHYPQDPIVSQMCDRYGIVASVEVPINNAVTPSAEFRNNCLTMTEEMIWQDFNSPSVVMWAYMNEVLLRPPYDRNDEKAKRSYMDFLFDLATDIETKIRKLDPDRYTMLPCHNNHKIYDECGISKLPMILGWNLYNGWYGNGLDGFEKALDKLHALYPEKTLLVTEYGADVDPRLHSFAPERFDFTCEYGMQFHRHYIPQILSRKWLAGAMVWNLNDFYSEGRLDAVPRVNNKGITGIDRERKDSYYLYRAWLSEKPQVTIGGHAWKIRGGCANRDNVCVQPVEVYSNALSVELRHNGKSLGEQLVVDRSACFQVPFVDGDNVLEAVAEVDGVVVNDLQRVDFRMIPYDFRDSEESFVELNVMLGSKRYFEDRTAEMVWIPEQAYRAGSWGYVGGEPSRTQTRHGSLPCSDVDVLHTDQDPIFQTQRMGIESFQADLPNGQYYVYLYFAELISGEKKQALAYNLGNDVLHQDRETRVFDVQINGVTVLKDFDMAKECGVERAIVKKFVVDNFDKNRIVVDFIPKHGKAVLNAIRIYKCH